jgi:biotin synthase
METQTPPSIGAYRRVQLARWLIDKDIITPDQMEFDGNGRARTFGLPHAELQKVISSGEPFRTSGCPGPDGEVACNRPYGNEKPGREIRNFPFSPEAEDIENIIAQMNQY